MVNLAEKFSIFDMFGSFQQQNSGKSLLSRRLPVQAFTTMQNAEPDIRMHAIARSTEVVASFLCSFRLHLTTKLRKWVYRCYRNVSSCAFLRAGKALPW